MNSDLFQAAGLPPVAPEDRGSLTDFVEQAEYLPPESFLAYSIEHPAEQEIIKKLISGGAKLLVGPRGSGKTTLMLKAFHRMQADRLGKVLPLYVNFKLSLKLEPLYLSTPNATFWFRTWLILKIYEALHDALAKFGYNANKSSLPSVDEITDALLTIESGDASSFNRSIEYQVDEMVELIEGTLLSFGFNRCVLLLDDAAHAFSPKQQEDFFDFFRRIKGQRIAPKAAIYPGITSLSPSFHVGHDAEQIDVWVRPDTQEYIDFMRELAAKRLGGEIPQALAADRDTIPFLAYAAFGIPRSFLNMIRYLAPDISNSTSVDRRKVLEAAKQSRQDAHAVFDSLAYKLPVYKNFILKGDELYTTLISYIKGYNRGRELPDQAVEFGIKRPMNQELNKLIGFFQYAGLVMHSGENSRGNKGVFDIYFLHFADLITENAIVGQRTKSMQQFVAVFKASKHQAWPRISPERLVGSNPDRDFALALPACQSCGTERANENAKFCMNCGAQLKMASLYTSLIAQDISVLPITKARAAKIRKHSNIRSIKDIMLDSTREELRGVPQIGAVWAERIARYAEEHVA